MSAADDLLREALAPLRSVAEPGADEVAAVFARRARADARRRSLAAIAVALVIAAAAASAIPPARAAIGGAFERFASVLTGRDDAHTVIGLTPQMSRWIDGGEGAVVLAAAGGEEMVAFREPATGRACIAYGVGGSECDDADLWRERFGRGGADLLAPLATTPARDERLLVAWGVAGEDVASVRLVYADGTARQAPVGAAGGFAVRAPRGRAPAAIEGLDGAGRMVASARADALQWEFPTGP
ncbi:MAG: hypothetical protein AB7V42_02365 [Thermoleophilia bacterium]